MRALKSILVVVDPSGNNETLIAKARALARQNGASIELFLCDADHAYSLGRTYETASVETARQACLLQARTHLQRWRGEVETQGIKVTTDVACESPLYQGIVRKVLSSRPDLVMKSITPAYGSSRYILDPNDWQLMRACPAQLLLVRPRVWSAAPHVLAAVDVSDGEAPEITASIMRAGELLALGRHENLHVAFCEEVAQVPSEPRVSASRLERLAHEYQLDRQKVYALSGDPGAQLLAFANGGEYDILALGALTHRLGLVALVGTLTTHLADGFSGDLLLVKPEAQTLSMSSVLENAMW